MNLDELQEAASEVAASFDRRYKAKHDAELTIMHLIEEFGELAREIYNQKTGRAALNQGNLAGEIADMYILLAHLGQCHGIRINDAVEKKLAQLRERNSKTQP